MVSQPLVEEEGSVVAAHHTIPSPRTQPDDHLMGVLPSRPQRCSGSSNTLWNRGISAENTPDTTVAIVKVSAVTCFFYGNYYAGGDERSVNNEWSRGSDS